MIRLEISPAEGPPFDHEIESGSLVVGRSTACDVAIADRFLSRQHARLFRSGDSWFVKDLGSRNGTFVNGRRVDSPAEVRPGDLITLSASQIRLRGGDRPDISSNVPTDAPDSDQVLLPAAEMLRRSAGPPPEDAESRPAELARHAARLSLLNQVHQAMARPTSLDELLELILDHIVAQLEPERVEVFMRCDDGSYACVAGRTMPGAAVASLYSESLFKEVADKAMAALVNDTRSDQRFAEATSLVSAGVRSLLAAPLAAPTRSLGLIVLGCNAAVRQYSEEDLELLVTLASVAALRIHNLALTKEAAERQRLEREISIARSIQVALLPERLPVVEGYRLHGATLPSLGVSGDYYQVATRAGGKELVLAVADVSGKGIGAAILTGYIEAVASVSIEDGLAPDEIFDRVSAKLFRRTPASRFATMFLGVLSPADGLLRYASAGHSPPCLVRGDGSVEWLRSTGLPLGLVPGASYRLAESILAPGDTLVVYSDGYTEAESPADEEFGPHRLASICTAERNREPAQLAACIDRALEAFVAGQPFADDRTLVVLRRLG
ncbi:MAG TPA: SpoIIE family protein phosphatase [Methylomirabilota bacterium]|nr:SpoIIE family protein phosphatase [Methylomirabilota bacterium]